MISLLVMCMNMLKIGVCGQNVDILVGGLAVFIM